MSELAVVAADEVQSCFGLVLGCFTDTGVFVFTDIVALLLQAHSGSEPGLHPALLQNSCQDQRVSLCRDDLDQKLDA